VKQPDRKSLDAYYREAESWAKDRLEALRWSRRIAWIIASVAVTVALFEASALILLMPLKTVVPYTLMVDRQTGYVQQLKPTEPNLIAPDAALTQSLLVQYVIARESYDLNELQADYRKVTLWSAESAQSDYVSGIQVSNPGSPLARYPRSTVIETKVKSVSPIGKRTALVRFETQRRDANAGALPPRSWVAILRYRFSDKPLTMEDRFLNPLGFQVLRYRRDMEALPAAEPIAQPSPLPSMPYSPAMNGHANPMGVAQ
jgi:type IV secretion system protein VirB8